ncbi:hypothetical protein [Nocardia rhizosphaerae]|uniref:Uncharacterized protein n=1 Tax=Nocardia rhizosphaerae TaxID=1691571 RepID=A0ABV8L8K5_9NOCA
MWRRVREYAVPWSMIETATARREVGDWAGACAAARVDVDLDLRAVARLHGRDLAAAVRADLRSLAPDLLRWHLPRVAPTGLLRPELTITLARYDESGCATTGGVRLVVRTAPAWAAADQRIVLALRDESEPGRHPHRRYRLDLHRHLWDARRAPELRSRSGAGPFAATRPVASAQPQRGDAEGSGRQGGFEVPLAASGAPAAAVGRSAQRVGPVQQGGGEAGCAVDRWAAEAEILRRADGHGGPFQVWLGARNRLILDTDVGGLRIVTDYPSAEMRSLPVLPDAATWIPPDVELLAAGAVTADQLHPLVATALEPGFAPGSAARGTEEYRDGIVDCRGERHRIGLVDGVLSALDHDPAELRREEFLVALTGTPLPCLRAIDEAHRHPEWLSGVRERLAHGDVTGALGVVERLLGPDAVLSDGPLRDSFEAVARQRVTYGFYRAGLRPPGHDQVPYAPRRPRSERRSRPWRTVRR